MGRRGHPGRVGGRGGDNAQPGRQQTSEPGRLPGECTASFRGVTSTPGRGGVTTPKCFPASGCGWSGCGRSRRPERWRYCVS